MAIWSRSRRIRATDASTPAHGAGAGLTVVRTEDFDFVLPPERIAHVPVRPRDAARQLHVTSGGLADHFVRDLPEFLRPGDLVVVNDTRVIPAQLSVRRGDARVGITLNQPRPDGTWHALARNARRLHTGDFLRVDGAGDLTAMVESRDADGGVILRFEVLLQLDRLMKDCISILGRGL